MYLTYVELCSSAGGMSLGLETAGWLCVAHAEGCSLNPVKPLLDSLTGLGGDR